MQKNKRFLEIVSIFLILVTIAMMYIANIKMVFTMDDLYYQTNLVTGKALSNISDIIESQIWHYFHWGGRTVAHFLLQVTLLCGNDFANVTNVICTAILVLIICMCAGKIGSWNALFTTSLLVILNANWSQTLLWEAGFANYVYTTIFILFFLYQYLKVLEAPEQKGLQGITLWIIPLGLIAGWTNENMGPALWVLTAGIIFYFYKTHKKIHIWMIFGNITCLIGSVFMIVSPGNQERIAANYSDVTYGWKMSVFLRFNNMAYALFVYLLPTVLVLLIMTTCYCIALKLKLRKTDIVLMAGTILSFGAMILSPHYPDRATFGTMVFMICTIVHMMSSIRELRKDLKIAVLPVICFCWLGMIFRFFEYIMQVSGLILS